MLTVGEYCQQRAAGTTHFAVVVRVELRCPELPDPIPCVANMRTKIGDIKRQFFAIWNHRQSQRSDPTRQLLFYTDDSRSTEWDERDDGARFLTSWMCYGATRSPLPVRIQTAARVNNAVPDGNAVANGPPAIVSLPPSSAALSPPPASIPRSTMAPAHPPSIRASNTTDGRRTAPSTTAARLAVVARPLASSSSSSTTEAADTAQLLQIYRIAKRYFRIKTVPKTIRQLINERLRDYIRRRPGKLSLDRAYPNFRKQ